MTAAFHNKIKKDLKKAHPSWSEKTLEQKTNMTMATIAKRSARSGTFPGKGRHKPAAKRKK